MQCEESSGFMIRKSLDKKNNKRAKIMAALYLYQERKVFQNSFKNFGLNNWAQF